MTVSILHCECRVKECWKEDCGVVFTDMILKEDLVWCRSLKEEIRHIYHDQVLERYEQNLRKAPSI